MESKQIAIKLFGDPSLILNKLSLQAYYRQRLKDLRSLVGDATAEKMMTDTYGISVSARADEIETHIKRTWLKEEKEIL